MKFIIILFMIVSIHLKADEWISYSDLEYTNNFVTCIAIDSKQNIWSGSNANADASLTKFDRTNWTIYPCTDYRGEWNIDINPFSGIWDMAIDLDDNIWLATISGVVGFDNSNWISFTYSGSALHVNEFFDVKAITTDGNGFAWIFENRNIISIKDSTLTNVFYCECNSAQSIISDANSNLWIGTSDGLLKYRNKTIEKYDMDNSELPGTYIEALAIDSFGNLWIGTANGLAQFDGNNCWDIYNTDNSLILDNKINAIAVDRNDNVWICTNKYLTKFDGESWISVTPPDTTFYYGRGWRISSIAIDSSQNKWIGINGGGIAVYNEDKVNLNANNKSINDVRFNLYENFPNPFNNITRIKFDLEKDSMIKLEIFNIKGQLIKTLINDFKYKGIHNIDFDGAGLNSGLYVYKLTIGLGFQAKKMLLLK